ncbi:hypothetical protein [Muribaculum gordoncarteri]
MLRKVARVAAISYKLSKSIHEPDITFKTLRIDRNEKECFPQRRAS